MGFDPITFAAALKAAKKSGGVELDTTLSDSTKAAPANLVGEVKTNAENANFLAELAMPGSLKWDGAPGDKEYVTLIQNGEMEIRYVKLTDEVPTILAPVALVGFNSGEGSSADSAEIVVNEETGTMSVGELFMIVPAGGVSADGITLSQGVWTMVQYYILNGQYIPIIYGSGLKIMLYSFAEEGADLGEYFEESVTEIGDTLTWDGDTTGLEVSKVGYKISDVIIAPEDYNHSWSVTATDGSAEETYTGDAVAEVETGVGVLNVANFAIWFVTEAYSGGDISPGVWVPALDGAYFSKITLNGYTFTVKGGETLKPEYLPASVVKNGDTGVTLTSPGGKVFNITVDDSGTITATEVTE